MASSRSARSERIGMKSGRWGAEVYLALGLALCLLFLSSPARPDAFLLNGGEDVVGRTDTYTTHGRESLIEIARDFGIGYNAISEANPRLDPFVPGEGVSVLLPMEWILPDVDSPSGIVINLSDYRLYHFYLSGQDRFVATFPVGIGDDGWTTPLGRFRIVGKTERPSWRPPPSILAEDRTLPRLMPPGTENPLGSHALRLSLGSVLIHGTNRPFGIGRKVSHGCIHLYPEDIPLLYGMVRRGTPVTIVRQPVKVCRRGHRVLLEAHRDDSFVGSHVSEAMRLLRKKGLVESVDPRLVDEALAEMSGVPTDVTAYPRIAGWSNTSGNAETRRGAD